MPRTHFIALLLFTGLQSLVARPNIIVFMADDWSYPHASAYGDTTVRTPHFDRIASEGILFNHAFVSTPSCTPSRLSILTGQHVWRLKEGDNLGGSLREEFDVYTEMLAESGYRIGRFGKGVWPSKHQFRQRDSFGPRFKSFGAFLEERKPKQPFCFWYGGKDPHRPFESGIGKKSGIDLASIQVPACLPDNATVRSDLADYYWCIQRFDREIGKVLAKLAAIGELENTLIVISGDNGMPFPRCKATLYDPGTRVPLAIRWGDQVKAGRRINDFINLCDLAPTFLEAAGMTPSEQMTGKSLLPILRSRASGQIDPQRNFVVTGMERHVYRNPSRAWRSAEFLYVRNFGPAKWKTGEIEGKSLEYDFTEQPWPTGPGAFSFNTDPSPSKQSMRFNRTTPQAKLTFETRPDEELYDLKTDPHQLRNLAAMPEHQEKLKTLRKALDKELRSSGDPRGVE